MNERLKEIKLTKQAKYGFMTMGLALIVGVGIATVSNSYKSSVREEVVNSFVPSENKDNEDIPVVVVEEEKLAKPFVVDASVKTYYFDLEDSSSNQENALIYYNGMYSPSYGVDYFYNNTNFDVVSVFEGTVIEKKVDPMYGATLYIKSNNNDSLVAVYASLSNIKVNVGDKVSQGQVIAKAGNNTINSNLGNHLNFSILKDNKSVNPLKYYSKEIKKI